MLREGGCDLEDRPGAAWPTSRLVGFKRSGRLAQTVHVIRVPLKRLGAFEQALVDRAGRHLEMPGEHERFRIEMGRWEVVAYGSGKVTISDERLVPVIVEVLDEVLEPVEATTVGSDEAGKGEWLGPLTVAACAVEPDERAKLLARGVMDSKELSRSAVVDVAAMVEDRLDHHEVIVVSPPRFNELFAEFKQEGQSLNDLVAWAHARALGEVLEGLDASDPDQQIRIVVDEFDRVATQARTSRAFDVERFPVEQRPRAEDEVAVAAASVLAKAARERWIDAYEETSSRELRGMSIDQAREQEDAGAFAKTSYL